MDHLDQESETKLRYSYGSKTNLVICILLKDEKTTINWIKAPAIQKTIKYIRYQFPLF